MFLHTAGLVTRNGHTKINLPRDQEGYGVSETTYEKLSVRCIKLCRSPSSIFIFLGYFWRITLQNQKIMKLCPALVDASQQELFVRSFKPFVALLVSRQINFCVSAQDVQSSCISEHFNVRKNGYNLAKNTTNQVFCQVKRRWLRQFWSVDDKWWRVGIVTARGVCFEPSSRVHRQLQK